MHGENNTEIIENEIISSGLRYVDDAVGTRALYTMGPYATGHTG
jgi:hypothetical protein